MSSNPKENRFFSIFESLEKTLDRDQQSITVTFTHNEKRKNVKCGEKKNISHFVMEMKPRDVPPDDEKKSLQKTPPKECSPEECSESADTDELFPRASLHLPGECVVLPPKNKLLQQQKDKEAKEKSKKTKKIGYSDKKSQRDRKPKKEQKDDDKKKDKESQKKKKKKKSSKKTKKGSKKEKKKESKKKNKESKNDKKKKKKGRSKRDNDNFSILSAHCNDVDTEWLNESDNWDLMTERKSAEHSDE